MNELTNEELQVIFIALQRVDPMDVFGVTVELKRRAGAILQERGIIMGAPAAPPPAAPAASAPAPNGTAAQEAVPTLEA